MAEVWIADDDEAIRFVLGECLRDAGLQVRGFSDAESVLHALSEGDPDAVVCDIRMPGAGGIALLEAVARRERPVPVIVMSAYTDVASTSAAYRAGAFDYLPKPFDLEAMRDTVMRALADQPPSDVAATTVPAVELIGSSSPMRELFRQIGRVAATGLNVLITGQTGTGKELVARALHAHGTRAGRAFVALNTAAIPAELLESELFGHEAGAFTGALKRHAGRFEQAHGGTLFLDEIGDMPAPLQTRLLRVLAQNEFYRVGGRELLRADVRLIAATHQDLDAKVEAGQFRADLLHRLDVVRLHVPALDERRDDVPLLAAHLLAQAALEAGVEAKAFSRDALVALSRRDWPGNVRQLQNLCRRLAVMAPGREIRARDLPGNAAPAASSADWQRAVQHAVRKRLALGETGIYADLRSAFDQAVLAAALAETGNRRGDAAARVGLGRNTLTRKIGSSRRRKHHDKDHHER